jgi:Transcriptional Coactivator p15 (PC4)
VWVNPNHPDPPRQAAAPQESGQRVATFARHGGEELRVNLAEYQGHPYLSLRVWAPGTDGQLWPVRGKGLAVKLREVAGLAEVLARVAGRLEASERRDDRQEGPPPDPRGSARPPFEPTRAPSSNRPGFDEF